GGGVRPVQRCGVPARLVVLALRRARRVRLDPVVRRGDVRARIRRDGRDRTPPDPLAGDVVTAGAGVGVGATATRTALRDGITLDAVTKSFTDRGSDRTRRVLDDISLRVEPGELVCVVGPSGCGKSTLLHMIAGLTTPDSGRVEVD